MSAELHPLRADEFDAWRARSCADYARDMQTNGGLAADAAVRKATADYDALLPDGVASEGHSIYAIEAGGERVGDLWVAVRDDPAGPALFVYEVSVREAARGRGFGRAAMLFAEEEARRRGFDRIALNVMGGNDVARGLYRSLDYDEIAVYMKKKL